ncbi:hypothetical protein XANCAGTX0491_009905 [Xanthoria calcicola]
MCLPDLIEIKPSPRRNRMHRAAGRPARSESSPPPCIITIEPRSPKVTQRDCSTRSGGLHIHGEASLRRKWEPRDSEQLPPEHHPSPRSPLPKPSTCEGGNTSKSSGSSSSSSSASSKSSFRDVQDKIANLVKRLANMEKELQADRERASQTVSISAARDNKMEKEMGGLKEFVGAINTRGCKMEKEIAGLKDAVGKINREVESLRKDGAWVKDPRRRSWDQAARHGDGGGGEGRVRVEWERVRRSPREASRSPRQGCR